MRRNRIGHEVVYEVLAQNCLFVIIEFLVEAGSVFWRLIFFLCPRTGFYRRIGLMKNKAYSAWVAFNLERIK